MRPAVYAPIPAIALIFAMTISLRASDRAAADRYEHLVYDHEVAAQCGLLSGEVRSAFRGQRDRLAAESGLGEDGLKTRRLAAIVAAMQEYDNRGLGGHRAWCDGDGRAGVARILSGDWMVRDKNP